MVSPRPSCHASVPALLAVAILALGWLLFGQAGQRRGAYLLPGFNDAQVEWLVDLQGRDFAAIRELPTDRWQRWNGTDFLRGGPGESLWQRVTLPRVSVATHGVVADTYLYSDEVTCYLPAGEGSWSVLRSGENVPAVEKPLAGREAAFPMVLAVGERRTIYLKTTDRFPCVSQLVWWQSLGSFMSARAHDVLAEGGYFGLLLALLFYNVALWSRLRFPDTGRYLLYLISVGLFMLISRNELLVLGVRVQAPWVEVGAMVTVSLSVVFLVDFARVFLDLPVSAPRWNHVTQALKYVMVCLAAWGLLMPWMERSEAVYLAILTGTVTQVALLGAAVAAWRNGVRQSRYFVAAFGSFLLGLIPSIRMWWWSDGLEDNAVAGFAVLGGSALEVLLFSMATADRFAQIERENLAAKETLLAEAEQRKAMQEAYADELELEVRERTGELMEANQDKDRMISVIGHDLRSPLTGLTQAAEQLRGAAPSASIDRFLTDTAQTGRQLLLLIEDLVLWARLRAGSIELASHPVSTLVNPVAALHRTVAQQRGAELEVQVPPGLRVRTDLVLAQTLLRNLLGNALKFAGQRVELRAAAVAEGVVFSVRDDGPGLPEEVARQFAEGAPLPPSTQGGMGLRLCREVGAALGLCIKVASSPGEGTEFQFTLPAGPEEERKT